MKKTLEEFKLVQNQQKNKKEILKDYTKLKVYENKLYKYRNVLNKHRDQILKESKDFYKQKSEFEAENLIIKKPIHYFWSKWFKNNIVIFILIKKNKEQIILFKKVVNGEIIHQKNVYVIIPERLVKHGKYYVAYFKEDEIMQSYPFQTSKKEDSMTSTNFRAYTNQKTRNIVFFPQSDGSGLLDKLLSPYGLIFLGIIIVCVLMYLHFTGVIDMSGVWNYINPAPAVM